MPERPSPKYVVICEKRSDAPNAIKIIKDGKIKFYSTSPEVCYELTKVGIKYADIETLYPDNLGDSDESYNNVLKMCSEIDSDNGYNAMKDNFYFVKRLYDALYIRTIVLKRLIEREKPDKIVVFTDESSLPDSEHPFSDGESIYAILLQTGKFNCEYVIQKRPKAKPVSIVEEKKREVPQSIYNILFCIKHRGLANGIKTMIFSVRNKISGNKTLLAAPGYNYSWQYIIPELTRAGFNLVNLDVSEFMAPYTDEPTKNIDKAKKYCVASGIDFGDVFIPLLRKKVATYDNAKASMYHAARLAIKKYKPYAIIGSAKTDFTGGLIYKAASDHWIPVVTWQHVAAYPPNYTRMTPFVETLNSDVHLSFGEGYSGFRKFGAIIHPVGSYNLNSLFFSSGRRRKQFDVLYVTAPYSGNNLYSSSISDNTLWKAQKAILDALVKQSRLKVAIKLPPGSPLNHTIYKYVGGKNIEIFNDEERTYHDLMRHSKVIISDHPSTTMLEAMAAGKEIFLLSDQVELTEEDIILLKKRVYLFDKTDIMFSTLEKYLRGEVIDNAPDKSNNEFLIKHGTHTLDNHVAKRIIEALRTIGGKESQS